MYKGSSKQGVKVFKPEKIDHSDVGKLKQAGLDADKVVWASPKKDYALAFAILFGKVRFGLFYKEGRKPVLSITSIDAQKKLDLDETVYLYKLEDATYTNVYGPEYISLEPVKVESVEEFSTRDALTLFDVYIPQKWEIN